MMDIATELAALRRRVADLEGLELPDLTGVPYTPTYDGAVPGATTYSAQVGQYVRFGNVAVVWGFLGWTAASGTGNAQISLPFTATATTAGSLRVQNLTFANGSIQAQIASGTNFILMHSPATNAGGTNVAVEAAGTVIFMAIYPI